MELFGHGPSSARRANTFALYSRIRTIRVQMAAMPRRPPAQPIRTGAAVTRVYTCCPHPGLHAPSPPGQHVLPRHLGIHNYPSCVYLGLRQKAGPPGRAPPGAARSEGGFACTAGGRERILADFAASGLSGNAFCRLPGSPSGPALGRWLAQAARGELDVPERSVRGRCEHAKHARYPEETKREAVSLARGGMSPAAVVRLAQGASGDVVSSSWCAGRPAALRMAPAKSGRDVKLRKAAARIADSGGARPRRGYAFGALRGDARPKAEGPRASRTRGRPS